MKNAQGKVINITIINKSEDRMFLKKWDPPNHTGQWLDGVDGSPIAREDGSTGDVTTSGSLEYAIGSPGSDKIVKVSWDIHTHEGKYDDKGTGVKCDHYFVAKNDVMYFVFYAGNSPPPRSEFKRKKRFVEGSGQSDYQAYYFGRYWDGANEW
ncbi:hypothetical protein TWF694_005164 [Orbilia ellipsospora]|uniref:Uncharacterized protein n=1 Tax=Orbilia ellipsospora TaxID=2528407 RepID=A0AAV9X0W8_9PEZI